MALIEAREMPDRSASSACDQPRATVCMSVAKSAESPFNEMLQPLRSKRFKVRCSSHAPPVSIALMAPTSQLMRPAGGFGRDRI